MSVYIKGMEMPTSCRACHLKMNCDDCEGLECVCVPLRQRIGYWDDLLTDKRRDDCPLVPVPEHGRLIDADALRAKQQEDADLFQGSTAYGDKCRRDEAMNAVANIVNAPTIIPASEEEMK